MFLTPVSRPAFCKTVGACLLFGLAHLGASPAGAAPIVANFTDGNSSSEVDAWIGTAGNGWQGPWTSQTNTSGVSLSAGVTATNPFPSGGNRLEVTVANSHASANRFGTVSRQYAAVPGIDLNQSHTISFEFRLDTSIDDINRFYFFDAGTATSEAEAAGTTWAVRVLADGNLVAYNRTSTTSLGMTLNQGEVYRFTIEVAPAAVAAESTYTVKVENLTTPDVVTSGSLLFYSAQTQVGGYLNFTSRVNAQETAMFSLDNIAVIPESSTVALAAAGLVSLGLTRMLRPRHASR